MKYRIGDVVQLVSKRPPGWVAQMDKHLGEIVTITNVRDLTASGLGLYIYFEGSRPYNFRFGCIDRKINQNIIEIW